MTILEPEGKVFCSLVSPLKEKLPPFGGGYGDLTLGHGFIVAGDWVGICSDRCASIELFDP